MNPDLYRLVIGDDAAAEVAEAVRSYEMHVAGLGRDFVRIFREATKALRRTPLQHQMVFGEVRRVVLRRFPYAVFYEIHDADVVVLACLHTARDPEAWLTRTGRLRR